MLVRTLSLLATYLMGRTSIPKEAGGMLSNITSGMISRVLEMMAVTLGSLIIFFCGAAIVTSDLIMATKEMGAISMTNLSWVGLSVMVVAVAVIAGTHYWVFKRAEIKARKQEEARQREEAHSGFSGLAETLTVMALEFISERKDKKMRAEAEKRKYASSYEARRSHDHESHVN